MLGALAFDAHAADRINREFSRLIGAVMLAATAGRSLGVAMTVRLFIMHHPSAPISSLEHHTLWGYMRPMREEIKTSCLKRLKRIEGQVRGLAGMVSDDRYCIDVVTQIAAARAALRRVEEEILRDHVARCVEHAIRSGDKADQRRKIAELMDVVGRAER
jgi:CsoR family transcriptional regulator, copper-sensing transcriptional repressor